MEREKENVYRMRAGWILRYGDDAKDEERRGRVKGDDARERERDFKVSFVALLRGKCV